MSQNKTMPTKVAVADYLATVMPERKRQDAMALDAMFRDATGFAPVMWGESIIGYGRYHYRYASGREGDFLATGFAPRKANLSVYIMPGYTDFGDILKDLGKHKLGKSCLYINKLSDVDLAVLARLVKAGLKNLNKYWPVHAT